VGVSWAVLLVVMDFLSVWGFLPVEALALSDFHRAEED